MIKLYCLNSLLKGRLKISK